MKWKCSKLKNNQRNCSAEALQNIFVEFEYNAKRHSCVHEMAQVHNLVGTSRICCKSHKLDLKAISHLLPNACFEKQKFAAITIRLGQPMCTVLLFTSGKMVLTGCKSVLDCVLASKQVFMCMCIGFPGVKFTLEPIKIQNIVGNAHLQFKSGEWLNINRFYLDYNVYCTYQPNMFPGLIYRPVDMSVVLLVFFSGKIVITGAKNMQDVYKSWETFSKILQKYVEPLSDVLPTKTTVFDKHEQS
jgi:transcription initiation factor TFIID TATA-box-binding protein